MKIPSKHDLEKFSVYEAVNYIEGLKPAYVSRPRKPILKNPHTSQEAKEYTKELEQFEKDVAEHEIASNRRGDLTKELYAVLEEYIKDEARLYDVVPKQYQDKVFGYAWREGHSSGYGDVYSHLVELVEIFEN